MLKLSAVDLVEIGFEPGDRRLLDELMGELVDRLDSCFLQIRLGTAANLGHKHRVAVVDGANDRLQVFKPDGTFVKEMFYNKRTLGSGSVWDIAFSKDAQQKYIFMADGENDRVHIIDRESLQILTTFGEGGRQPGMFYGVHSIAVDSKGNIYTTETYRGQRVQRFLYKGLAPVTKMDQGVVWPAKK